MTKIAAQLLQLISESPEHLTADELFRECKTKNIKCSVASVYRNLTALVDGKYVRRVIIPGEPDRFDKSLMPHEHLICSHCKHVQDIHVADLQKVLEQHLGVKIDSYDLTMHYVCERCKKK